MDAVGLALAVAAILALTWMMAGGGRSRGVTDDDGAPAVRDSDDVTV